MKKSKKKSIYDSDQTHCNLWIRGMENECKRKGDIRDMEKEKSTEEKKKKIWN